MSRLEEIKQSIKEIMETPYGIRSIKAKEVGIDLVMTGKIDSVLQEIDMLKEENQRYKQAIEEASDQLGNPSLVDGVYRADLILTKALKGESEWE